MGKYLDSIDYNKIVFNTFQLPESDFYKYYSNKVEDHVSDNPDLFDELLRAIERRIDWYRDQHSSDYSIDDWGRDKDGNVKLDKNGNMTKVTRILDFDEADQVYIPLSFALPGYGLNRSINKSFFDEQIRIVLALAISHNIKTLVGNSELKPRKGRKAKPITYKSLFRNPAHADQVKEILEKNEITKNNKYVKDPERSGNDSELLAAYYVLQPLFNNYPVAPAATCFYNEFVGPSITPRMMNHGISEYHLDRIRFKKIFFPLLKFS